MAALLIFTASLLYTVPSYAKFECRTVTKKKGNYTSERTICKDFPDNKNSRKKSRKKSRERSQAKSNNNLKNPSSFREGERVLAKRSFYWFSAKASPKDLGMIYLTYEDPGIKMKDSTFAEKGRIKKFNWKNGTRLECYDRSSKKYISGTTQSIFGNSITIRSASGKNINSQVGLCREKIIKAKIKNTDYRAQLPSVKQVFADIKGKNRLDTAARRAAALNILIDVLDTFRYAYHGPIPPPEEDRLTRNRYHEAHFDIFKKVLKKLDPKRKRYYYDDDIYYDAYDNWRMLFFHYWYEDEAFTKSIIKRYFSEGLQAAYLYTYALGHPGQLEAIAEMRQIRKDDLIAKKKAKKEAKEQAKREAEHKKMMAIFNDINAILQKYAYSYEETTLQTRKKDKAYARAIRAYKKKYTGKYRKFTDACVRDVRPETRKVKGTAKTFYIDSYKETGRYSVIFYLPISIGNQSVELVKVVKKEKTALSFQRDKCYSVAGKIRSIQTGKRDYPELKIKIR